MSTTSESLLVKFRAKDTLHGVTRKTVKAMAAELDVPETQVIHLALSRLAQDVLPTYEPDGGPLTARQAAVVRNDAAKHLPQGKLISRQDLFK